MDLKNRILVIKNSKFCKFPEVETKSWSFTNASLHSKLPPFYHDRDLQHGTKNQVLVQKNSKCCKFPEVVCVLVAKSNHDQKTAKCVKFKPKNSKFCKKNSNFCKFHPKKNNHYFNN